MPDIRVSDSGQHLRRLGTEADSSDPDPRSASRDEVTNADVAQRVPTGKASGSVRSIPCRYQRSWFPATASTSARSSSVR